MRKYLFPACGLLFIAIGMTVEWASPDNRDSAVLAAVCGTALVVAWCFVSIQRTIVEGQARHKLLRESETMPIHDNWFQES